MKLIFTNETVSKSSSIILTVKKLLNLNCINYIAYPKLL